jgi:hypothetical protein
MKTDISDLPRRPCIAADPVLMRKYLSLEHNIVEMLTSPLVAPTTVR